MLKYCDIRPKDKVEKFAHDIAILGPMLGSTDNQIEDYLNKLSHHT